MEAFAGRGDARALCFAQLTALRNRDQAAGFLDALRTIRRADSATRGSKEFPTCRAMARDKLDALAGVVKRVDAFMKDAQRRRAEGVLDDETLKAELVTPKFILSLAASLETLYPTAVAAKDSDALKCIMLAAGAVVNRVTQNQSILLAENYPADEPAVRQLHLETRNDRAELLVAAVAVSLLDLSSSYRTSTQQ